MMPDLGKDSCGEAILKSDSSRHTLCLFHFVCCTLRENLGEKWDGKDMFSKYVCKYT